MRLVLFENSMRVQNFDFSIRYRAGFVARPFTTECEVVEHGISSIFRERGVAAQSYLHTPGSKFVLEDLKSQIRDCHFAIVDITGLNLNVLAEIGMLISLDKPFIILRDERDEGEPPFDIRAYHCYRYRVDGGTAITVRSPWSELSLPLAQVITRFIDELIQRDPAFAEAKPKS
jgi:hypothetical protein